MIPTVAIDASALAIFPDLQVFSLVIDNYGRASATADWGGTRESVAESIRERDAAPVLPSPITAWREAYRTMGFKPSRTLSSVEALVRRARKPDSNWMTGVQAVDFYNAFSIRHLAPLGGYATTKLTHESIVVRATAPHSDHYVPIGGRVDGSKTSEKVVVYATGRDIMCWALNHRDSASFGLEDDTGQAIFLSEALNDEQAVASQAALNQLAEVARYHGARPSPICHHAPHGFAGELVA